MRSAQDFHTYAVSPGVAGAHHRNSPYVAYVPNDMDRQQNYYFQQQQQQSYIPMGQTSMHHHQSYAPGPMTFQSPQVYVPTTRPAVQYAGQQPVYYVEVEPPPSDDCVALRQCWDTVPQVYRWPFIIGIAFLFLLLIGFVIAFFVLSTGGGYDF